MSPEKVTIDDMMDHLGIVNRAYQVCYALGDTSSTVRTLTGPEAAAIVAIVSDVRDGHVVTDLDRILAHKLSPAMKEYVAGGVLDMEAQ